MNQNLSPGMGMGSERALLQQMFAAAVQAAAPATCVPPHLPPPPAGRTIVGVIVGRALYDGGVDPPACPSTRAAPVISTVPVGRAAEIMSRASGSRDRMNGNGLSGQMRWVTSASPALVAEVALSDRVR